MAAIFHQIAKEDEPIPVNLNGVQVRENLPPTALSSLRSRGTLAVRRVGYQKTLRDFSLLSCTHPTLMYRILKLDTVTRALNFTNVYNAKQDAQATRRRQHDEKLHDHAHACQTKFSSTPSHYAVRD